jgi:formate-dependent phosphoribosylglycinamide formyltransferase (GAR transformylase)
MQLHILLSSIVTYVMLFGSGKLINKIIITFQYFGVEVIVVN